MSDTIFCEADRTAESCAKLHGIPGPYSFNMVSGTDAPEGNVTGYGPASFYFRSSTTKWYAFGGTAGTKVGWNILN